MHASEIFLLALAIIFTVPYLLWRVGRTDHYAPLVVVQIVTGILLGPGVLGAAYPGYYAFVFGHEVVQALSGVAVGWPGWVGADARPWQFVLGVGMACAVTALPILILLMEKLGILRLPLGQRILRYASLDDVAIWALIGWLLQTKALIMIIFANILLDKRLITSETFTALLLMAVASTMLTVPVVAARLERMKDVVLRPD